MHPSTNDTNEKQVVGALQDHFLDHHQEQAVHQVVRQQQGKVAPQMVYKVPQQTVVEHQEQMGVMEHLNLEPLEHLLEGLNLVLLCPLLASPHRQAVLTLEPLDHLLGLPQTLLASPQELLLASLLVLQVPLQ